MKQDILYNCFPPFAFIEKIIQGKQFGVLEVFRACVEEQTQPCISDTSIKRLQYYNIRCPKELNKLVPLKTYQNKNVQLFCMMMVLGSNIDRPWCANGIDPTHI